METQNEQAEYLEDCNTNEEHGVKAETSKANVVNIVPMDETEQAVEFLVERVKQMPPKKANKRKSFPGIIAMAADEPGPSTPPAKKPRKAAKKPDPIVNLNGGDEVLLYAYKHCLGEMDSLVQNSTMPLWIREGNFLIQKLARLSCDDDGLFYQSTRVYSYWPKEEAWKYFEVKAEVVDVTPTQVESLPIIKFRILNVQQIEQEINGANFKTLQLSPYKSGSGRDDEENDNNDDSSTLEASEIVEDDLVEEEEEAGGISL